MKKILAILLMIATMLCIVSCGISDDPKEIKKALEEEDYEVEIIKKADAVEAMLEAWDIDADVTAIVTGGDEDDNGVYVVICEDSKSAKEVAEYFEEMLEELEEQIEEYELDIDIDDYKIGTSGKIAYFGTKDAIKAIGG